MNFIEKTLRTIGFGFNLATFLFFAFFAIKLWGIGLYLLASAGGLMEITTVKAIWGNPSAGAVYLWTLIAAPGFMDRIIGFIGAWFSLIGAAGFSWMTVLGARWLFGEVLRVTVK